ncbi:hypothetical protein OB905_14050 [Halobacteria archaeon AArc-dxtr1]|nr:hypothetical protein [Halobacteria archaeon AArc-dxtr1]
MTDHQFEEGNRVRIDIPDETDPDYNRFHGRHGEIVALFDDDAGAFTKYVGKVAGKDDFKIRGIEVRQRSTPPFIEDV